MMIIKGIASPAGSGMNFAMDLLKLSFKDVHFAAVGHERKDMEETSGPQIAILRNPYDVVSSGTERWIRSAGHQDFLNSEDLIEESDEQGIKDMSNHEEKRYYNFFNEIDKLENVKVISFELLTQNKEKFVKEVAKHFGLEDHQTQEASDQEVFDSIIERKNVNRVPREKSAGRDLVNKIVEEMYPKETWACWKIYSELKAKLDEQGL